MAFPTVTVTPGSGQTVNTLPNAGQATSANSLGVVIASDQSAVPVSGTFWQTTQPVSGTVTANAGTGTFAISAASLPLPTGASVSVAQSSTTSGQSGGLIMGAVTTAAPIYTTAQTNPLSLTTAGGLRGDLSSYAGTALTGTVTAYGTAPTGNVFGVNAAITNTPAVTISSGTVTTVSTVTSVTNVAQIASNTPAYAISNGSTNKLAAVSVGTAYSIVDQNATAFAGAGSVAGTVVASTQGGGAVISAEINVTALTLGTATQVYAILQESSGGTNFSDIWVSDPITATGITRTPAIPVTGRRRWRFFSVGGTSTTVTATITTLELPPGSYPIQRQGRDGYAATNPFVTTYNSTVLFNSTFVLSTASTVTAPFYIEGTKQLTAFMTLAGGPTVTTQPVVTLQLSMDGTNFWTVAGATMTAAGNGTYAITNQSIGGVKFARLIVSTAAAYSSGAYTISNIGVNAVN